MHEEMLQPTRPHVSKPIWGKSVSRHTPAINHACQAWLSYMLAKHGFSCMLAKHGSCVCLPSMAFVYACQAWLLVYACQACLLCMLAKHGFRVCLPSMAFRVCLPSMLESVWPILLFLYRLIELRLLQVCCAAISMQHARRVLTYRNIYKVESWRCK